MDVTVVVVVWCCIGYRSTTVIEVSVCVVVIDAISRAATVGDSPIVIIVCSVVNSVATNGRSSWCGARGRQRCTFQQYSFIQHDF